MVSLAVATIQLGGRLIGGGESGEKGRKRALIFIRIPNPDTNTSF